MRSCALYTNPLSATAPLSLEQQTSLLKGRARLRHRHRVDVVGTERIVELRGQLPPVALLHLRLSSEVPEGRGQCSLTFTEKKGVRSSESETPHVGRETVRGGNARCTRVLRQGHADVVRVPRSYRESG